jgi:DNA-binding NarL/FixJ family response regulator
MELIQPPGRRDCEPRFSPRQTEIVSLIASGYSDKQIALALRVSRRTVRTQLERLYATNGLHCRAQAVHIWALAGRRASAS